MPRRPSRPPPALTGAGPMQATKRFQDMNKRLRPLIALLLGLGVTGTALVGCDDQGPAEEAGEQIDDTADDAGDSFDDD